MGDRDISRVVAVGGWQRGCLCVCVGGSAWSRDWLGGVVNGVDVGVAGGIWSRMWPEGVTEGVAWGFAQGVGRKNSNTYTTIQLSVLLAFNKKHFFLLGPVVNQTDSHNHNISGQETSSTLNGISMTARARYVAPPLLGKYSSLRVVFGQGYG